MPLARGMDDWRRAIGDDAIELFGNPRLVEQLPSWFVGPPAAEPSSSHRRAGRLAAKAAVTT